MLSPAALVARIRTAAYGSLPDLGTTHATSTDRSVPGASASLTRAFFGIRIPLTTHGVPLFAADERRQALTPKTTNDAAWPSGASHVIRWVWRTPPPSAGCSLRIAKVVPVGLSGGVAAPGGEDAGGVAGDAVPGIAEGAALSVPTAGEADAVADAPAVSGPVPISETGWAEHAAMRSASATSDGTSGEGDVPRVPTRRGDLGMQPLLVDRRTPAAASS